MYLNLSGVDCMCHVMVLLLIILFDLWLYSTSVNVLLF